MQSYELAYTAVAAIADRIVTTGTAGVSAPADSPVDRLYGLVAAQLNGSTVGAQILRTLEAQPTDPVARQGAAQAVAAEADANSHFADELRRLAQDVPIGGGPSYAAAGGGGADAGARKAGVALRNVSLDSTGAFFVCVVLAVLMLFATALYVNVVWPRAGLTEGARLDHLAGSWSAVQDGEVLRMTVSDEGVVTLSGENAFCQGSVSSPGRSEYLFGFNCGLGGASGEGELSWFGDSLKLSIPDDDDVDVFEFSRE